MAKLSAREQKVRKQAQLTKKVAPIPKAKGALIGSGPLLPGQKRVPMASAPLVGEGPLLPGQGRIQAPKGDLVGAGPLLPSQKRVADSYKGGTPKKSNNGNSRTLAQKAFNGALGIDTAEASTGSDINMGQEDANSTPTTFGKGLNVAKNVAKALPGIGALVGSMPDLGLTEKFGFNNLLRTDNNGMGNWENPVRDGVSNYINKPYKADLPTGYGPQGETFFNNNSKPSTIKSDFATPGTNFSRPGSEQAYLRGEDPRVSNGGKYGVPLNPQQKSPFNEFGGVGSTPYGPQRPPNDTGLNFENSQDQHQSYRDLMALLESNNAQNSNSPEDMQLPGDAGFDTGLADSYDPFPTDGSYQPTTNSVRRSIGSGAFGNGKMVGNPSGLSKEEKAYIKELRASMGGDFGASNVENQYGELIKALDPTYDLQQKTAEEELNKAKLEDINKLSSMFAQNNTAGSEQQQQYVQRTQGDYAAQLANLLAKLAQSKNQDVTQFKTQMQNRLGDIAQTKQSQQQKIADMIRQVQDGAQSRALDYQKMQQQMAQQEFDNNYKMATLRKGSTRAQSAGSVTYLGDDANGNPVYRNNKTGMREVGTGLTRTKVDPMASLLQALQGGGQQPQIKYDENGRPYYEE